MRLIAVKVIFYMFILLCTSVQAKEFPQGITPEQAYEQGTLLYQQNKYTHARPYLDFATDNGYPAAALMMADTYWTNLFIQTEKEADYLLKAAEMGSVIGMVRLGSHRSLSSDSEVWRGLIFSEVEALAKEGNAYAMNLMFALVKDRDKAFDWLIEAAEAGHPPSQHGLAVRYRDGKGFFIWPGSREEEIARLMSASAKSGYRAAMLEYVDILEGRGEAERAQKIISQLLDIGDAATIHRLASRSRRAGDNFTAAYYYRIHMESIGRDGDKGNYDTIQSIYKRLTTDLSVEEVDEVIAKAKAFVSTHTVHYQKNIKEYEYTLESIKQLN